MTTLRLLRNDLQATSFQRWPMMIRSLLFVPGDQPQRFSKAAASGADAVILDLEDSVSEATKATARLAVASWLREPRTVPLLVRINPVDSEWVSADLDALRTDPPDAIMLPKAEGAATVRRLAGLVGQGCPPILPIASETAAAVFEIGSFRDVSDLLIGLTWGAEDLPAAVGASSARHPDGSYTAPYEMVRSLTLFGAHAAGVAAIETVFPAIADTIGLEAYVARARRDGFTGMMAIHPSQVSIINGSFAASDAELARARAIVQCFADHPGAGALRLDGEMIDRPHLVRAQALLARRH